MRRACDGLPGKEYSIVLLKLLFVLLVSLW